MTSAGQAGAATTSRGARGLVVPLLSVVGVLYLGYSAFGAVFGGDDSRGEVIRVIDGDTLVALVDGEETTIRLLNVDTPETKDPNQPVQCLGPEATAFLAERLPEGTEIDLEYDEERTDRYGRTLAGVFESDSLVNAEIAAAGLGVPVLFEPNDRFLADVERASAEAQDEGRGLYAASIACTVAAQLESVQTAAAQLPAQVEGDPAAAVADAALVVEDAEGLVAGLAAHGGVMLGNDVLTRPSQEDYLSRIRDEADEAHRSATSAHADLTTAKTAYDTEQIRLAEEREEAERLEEERREAERLAAERAEEEQRAEEQQAEEEQRTQKKDSAKEGKKETKKESKKETKKSSSSDEEKSSSGGCTPYGPEIRYDDDGGYTGKRYGMPGGETFRKCR